MLFHDVGTLLSLLRYDGGALADDGRSHCTGGLVTVEPGFVGTTSGFPRVTAAAKPIAGAHRDANARVTHARVSARAEPDVHKRCHASPGARIHRSTAGDDASAADCLARADPNVPRARADAVSRNRARASPDAHDPRHAYARASADNFTTSRHAPAIDGHAFTSGGV